MTEEIDLRDECREMRARLLAWQGDMPPHLRDDLQRAGRLLERLMELDALKLTVVKPLNLGPSISTGTRKD